MAGGEVCFKLFNRVVEPSALTTRTSVPAFKLKECCFSLPALANLVGSDYYENDQHTIYGKYDTNFYSLVTILIEKYVNGIWTQQEEVLGNTSGTSYNYGLYTSSDFTQRYVAFIADWQKILNNYGEGSYRFRFKEIDFALNTTYSVYPFEFCLRGYTEDRANGTTRFDFTLKGYSGNWVDDTDTWDFTRFPNGLFNQIRLPDSFFGYNKSSYEREYIRYSNGQQQWLQDEQIEGYSWNSGHYPAELHDFLKTNMIQADELSVTDYNSNNPNIIKDKQIKPDSNYEPEWQYNNKRAFVNLDFVQEYQNRRKRRC